MNRGSYRGWVAEVQERVVAGVGLMLLEWGPGHLSESTFRGRVVNVFTEPVFRRRGLARALVQQCQDVMDDAISTGQTTAAALALAQHVGAGVSAVVVAMIQGERWKTLLAELAPERKGQVCGVFYSPRLVRAEEGWVPE